ncbi:Protein FD like [Actinidia chinensis var. chinensis]|uniref:Protein FD like n=1 Tax=Actinidia chinensis var. chinensis TaxID=1590841 RepID=A0A2R6RMH8_ACTCC|nr:Protein FD like [Actinidia chinensis var. chinensis]
MWTSSSSGNKNTSSNPKPSTPCLCPKKSMEEVWKGMSLSSPNHQHNRRSLAAAALNLQDFLACPSSKTGDRPFSGGKVTVAGRLAQPPTTALSLSTSSQDDDGGSRPYFMPCLEDLSSSTDLFPSLCNKRGSENEDNSGNWRHKRLMKNRESAARSRARKQAYANGLEMEVARLLDENANLRRQLEKFKSAAAVELPKKNTLLRTLTAPF